MKVTRTNVNTEKSLDKILDVNDKKLLDAFLKSFYENIKEKYDLKDKKLEISLKEKDVTNIPCSIFVKELGILEAIVKFLHENRRLSFKEISSITKRSINNVSVSYKNATRKFSKPFKIDYTYKIPYKIFSTKYTCFESICLYLKSIMSYHEIAVLLNRDDRTIWTIYQRALKKGAKKSKISGTHKKPSFLTGDKK